MHIWRQLLKIFRTTLGVGYKGETHSDVDVTELVLSVKRSAEDWELLQVRDKTPVDLGKGRKRSGVVKKRTVDVLAVGADRLATTKNGSTMSTFYKNIVDTHNGVEAVAEVDELAPPPEDFAVDSGEDS